MARIRTVKPEFWSSEQIVECSPMARLLFIGLWNFCDDDGIHPASAKTIKARVFPADDMDSATVRRMLDELSSHGLIQFYVVDDVEYLWVTGWAKHQKVERPSYKYPKPPKTKKKIDTQSPNDRRTLDARHPPELEIGRELENDDDARVTPPPLDGPAKPRDPNLDLAREIIAAYGRAVQEVWNLPTAPMPKWGTGKGDLPTAAAWARDGVTLDLVLEVLGPVLAKKRDQPTDNEPPGGLIYLDKAVRRKLAEIVGKPAEPVDPVLDATAQRYIAAVKAWKDGGKVGEMPRLEAPAVVPPEWQTLEIPAACDRRTA